MIPVSGDTDQTLLKDSSDHSLLWRRPWREAWGCTCIFSTPWHGSIPLCAASLDCGGKKSFLFWNWDLYAWAKQTIRTLCDVFMMSVQCGFVCSLQHINQQMLWRRSLLGKLKYSDNLGQDLLHYYFLNAIEDACCIKNKGSRRRSIK